MDVYNQTIDGDVACAITAAVWGQTQVEQKSCAATLKIRGGGCAIHQNGNGEVQMSEVGYTVSTNSNASGRNTPLVLVLNDQGGA